MARSRWRGDVFKLRRKDVAEDAVDLGATGVERRDDDGELVAGVRGELRAQPASAGSQFFIFIVRRDKRSSEIGRLAGIKLFNRRAGSLNAFEQCSLRRCLLIEADKQKPLRKGEPCPQPWRRAEHRGVARR